MQATLNKSQTALFGEQRLTPERSMQLTAESLRGYGLRYKHWALAFSGGKDSTAAATAVADLVLTGAVPAPESLTFLYADTRMELPPLHASAMKVMDTLRAKGFNARVVLPEMDDRFMVYMFGRGVPPPSNTFRWCTAQIKIEPMLAALADLREQYGEKFLMLTGVRVGESAARDQRISVSCGKNGSECGQGWFQVSTPESVADTLAPLLHWRLCHVWDWLMFEAPALGYDTRMVAEVYGIGEDGSIQEKDARTGCVGCNLASKDAALERVIGLPGWEYIAPLRRLRPLYAELKKPGNRLRKMEETRADGSAVSNQGRLGPLTMEARRWGMAQVIGIQDEINAARGESPAVTLIDDEERARIEYLIAANTWPNRWEGTEIVGDTPLSMEFTRGNGRQFTMALEMAQ